MDPRDRPSSFAEGVACAACGWLVPLDRVRVLARREDLAFVELACAACHSESLGILVEGEPDPDAAAGDPAGATPHAPGEFVAADEVRFRNAMPIVAEDLQTVARILRDGGLGALLGQPADGDDGPTAGPSR